MNTAAFSLASTAISGGDGDGIIESDECNALAVTITFGGAVTATGIVGVLSTNTSGVTVTQPISDYADLAPGASGSSVSPFLIGTSPGFSCGTPIHLTLTLTYDQGTEAISITLPTCTCPSETVHGSIEAGDLTSLLRVSRDGVPTTCASPHACAPIGLVGPYRYDTYTFTNGSAPSCVTVTLTTGCYGHAIQATAYLGSFDPTNVCLNYLGDIGLSPANSRSFSVDVPANANIVVVVDESYHDGCSDYTVEVSGLVCDGVGVGNGACGQGCVHGQGFWRTHPNVWPVNSLTLGTVNYDRVQLLSIFNQPVKGNGLVSLAYQLIAARLNLASGAATTPEVTQAIADANALIDGQVIPPVGSDSVNPAATSALTTALENYNNGHAPGGPPSCP